MKKLYITLLLLLPYIAIANVVPSVVTGQITSVQSVAFSSNPVITLSTYLNDTFSVPESSSAIVGAIATCNVLPDIAISTSHTASRCSYIQPTPTPTPIPTPTPLSAVLLYDSSYTAMPLNLSSYYFKATPICDINAELIAHGWNTTNLQIEDMGTVKFFTASTTNASKNTEMYTIYSSVGYSARHVAFVSMQTALSSEFAGSCVTPVSLSDIPSSDAAVNNLSDSLFAYKWPHDPENLNVTIGVLEKNFIFPDYSTQALGGVVFNPGLIDMCPPGKIDTWQKKELCHANIMGMIQNWTFKTRIASASVGNFGRISPFVAVQNMIANSPNTNLITPTTDAAHPFFVIVSSISGDNDLGRKTQISLRNTANMVANNGGIFVKSMPNKPPVDGSWTTYEVNNYIDQHTQSIASPNAFNVGSTTGNLPFANMDVQCRAEGMVVNGLTVSGTSACAQLIGARFKHAHLVCPKLSAVELKNIARISVEVTGAAWNSTSGFGVFSPSLFDAKVLAACGQCSTALLNFVSFQIPIEFNQSALPAFRAACTRLGLSPVLLQSNDPNSAMCQNDLFPGNPISIDVPGIQFDTTANSFLGWQFFTTPNCQ